MKHILLVCPQERDLVSIAAANLDDRYEIHAVGTDLDQLDELDPVSVLEACEGVPADGVVGTKDLSALLAAIVAKDRGLPGPSAASLVSCQHKPTSRTIQRQVAPKATPQFVRLNGEETPTYPFFVKPVIGRLSQNARRIDDADELFSLHEIDEYTQRYSDIALLAGVVPDDVHGFLAEELMDGAEVTLEGYVHQGRVTSIGVTDSVKYPGTNSFERFEYPTVLPVDRQEELAALAGKVVLAHGFDNGFFNVEFFVPGSGPAQIIEVNGRIASQFAPLVQELHGRSTYDALFALACGDDPRWEVQLPDGVGLSYCKRVFSDAFVEAVPAPEDGLELLVRQGRWLSEQGVNDAESYRLAIFYATGRTREEVVQRSRMRADALSFQLLPSRVRAR